MIGSANAKEESLKNALLWKLAQEHHHGIGYVPFTPVFNTDTKEALNWRERMFDGVKGAVLELVERAVGVMKTGKRVDIKAQLKTEAVNFADPTCTRFTVLGCGHGKTLLAAAVGAVCKSGTPRAMEFGLSLSGGKVSFCLFITPYVTVGVAVHQSWAMTAAIEGLNPYFWGYPASPLTTLDASHVVIVTPERLMTPEFREWYKEAVRRCYMVVVDEAHLLLTQSHFRPSMEALPYGLRATAGAAGLRLHYLTGTAADVWLRNDAIWKIQPFRSLLSPCEQSGEIFVSAIEEFSVPRHLFLDLKVSLVGTAVSRFSDKDTEVVWFLRVGRKAIVQRCSANFVILSAMRRKTCWRTRKTLRL